MSNIDMSGYDPYKHGECDECGEPFTGSTLLGAGEEEIHSPVDIYSYENGEIYVTVGFQCPCGWKHIEKKKFLEA